MVLIMNMLGFNGDDASNNKYLDVFIIQHGIMQMDGHTERMISLEG